MSPSYTHIQKLERTHTVTNERTKLMTNATDSNVQAKIVDSNIPDPQHFSLRILSLLAKHSGEKDVYFDPGWNTRKPSPGLRRLLDPDEIDQWRQPPHDWRWDIRNVLEEEGLLQWNGIKPYCYVISDKGREFLGKQESEQRTELGKIWQKYEETKERFLSPIPVEKFYEAILLWEKEWGEKRSSLNAKRYLAELTVGQRQWDDLKNLPNSYQGLVRTTLVESLGWFLAGYFYPEMKRKNKFVYFLWKSGIFEKGGFLLPAFRAALETLNKDGKIDLENWKRISIEPPGKSIATTPEDEDAPDEIEEPDDLMEDTGIEDQQSLMEGGAYQKLCTIYERSSLARHECLKTWGYRCAICDFDFEDEYGDLGKGYIHVHHLKPISESEGEIYQIDPVEDLFPVCPNCHAMLHRENPVVPIERLVKIVKERRNRKR